MEVGESLFSASERHALDSFLAGIEGGDALDRPYTSPSGQTSNGYSQSQPDSTIHGFWAHGGAEAGPSRRSAGTRPPEIDFPRPYAHHPSPGMPPAAPSSPFWLPSSRPTSASGFPPPGAAAVRDGPAIWRPPSPPGEPHPSSSAAYADQSISAKRRRMDHSAQGEMAAAGKGRTHAGGPSAGAAGSSNGQPHALHPRPYPAGSTSPLSFLGSSELYRSAPYPTPATSRLSTSTAGPSSDRRGSTAASTAPRPGPGPTKRPKKAAASVTTTASPAASTSGAPAPLLTAAQKKANHIASEQKRRANIKRGHDQLCEIVPALRDAIAEAERKEREGLASGAGAARVKKKGKAKKGKNGGDDGTVEKVDGRAGPKSEGTVLLRTIEHIRALQAQRLALLARLSAARRHAQARFAQADHEALGIAHGQTIREEDDWDGDVASGSEDDG